MAVKVWHIKGLLKEIKVHHCHTCSPIISLWQVSAFNHDSASENRAMFPITIAVTLQTPPPISSLNGSKEATAGKFQFLIEPTSSVLLAISSKLS